MNKHLNDWMDKAEGLPEGTSNKGIVGELKRQGYTPKRMIDNNGKEFVGWEKDKDFLKNHIIVGKIKK